MNTFMGLFGKQTQSRRQDCSPRQKSNLLLEELESRDLLSTSNPLGIPATILPNQVSPSIQNITPLSGGGINAVYTPSQIRAFYNFNSQSNTGVGQTIAIIDAYNDPNLVNDLAHFDANFGLPGQTSAAVNSFLTRVNENGQPNALPAANSNWIYETSLDVEWAHAMAPAAHILLVEASSDSGYDLLTALNTARFTNGVSVVSMSWGSSEFNGETYYDSYFTTPTGHIAGNNQPGGITFVASAGDSGAWYGPEWPSVSPNVLAVGGTTLLPSGNQSAWSGGGGGYSYYETRPTYQVGFNPVPVRSTPDVSYSADPGYGYYVYDTYGLPSSYSGWWSIGGTSAGAPQWAAIIALADQARATNGLPSLTGGQSGLYTLTPASAFNDITTGSNGYAATVGYDVATGRGSPYANRIIAALSSKSSTVNQVIRNVQTSSLITQTIIATGITAVGSPENGTLAQSTPNMLLDFLWSTPGQSNLPDHPVFGSTTVVVPGGPVEEIESGMILSWDRVPVVSGTILNLDVDYLNLEKFGFENDQFPDS